MSSLENGTPVGAGESIGGRGSSRLLNKLMEAINSKKFYEAHQLVKTISFRYLAAKNFVELEELLCKVAFILLDNAQYESGSDVSVMISKLYLQNDSNLPPTDARVSRILNILQRIPSSAPERLRFISEINEWLESEEHISGKFHSAVAQIYIGENAYSDAWKHIIRTNDGNEAASLTRRVIIESFIRRDELDIVIAMLIIGLLTLKRIKEADEAYRALVTVEDFPELSPLLNGVRYLVEAAKMNNPGTFTQIVEIYEPSFSREQHLRKLVYNAGKVLFNLSERSSSGAGNSMPISMMMNAFLAQDQASLD